MHVERIGPVFGAELRDVDLVEATVDGTTERIDELLCEHEVLVVRDQRMDADQQLAFGRCFGQLAVSPFSPNDDAAPELIVLDTDASTSAPLTDIWHADETYKPEPPRMTILKSVIAPRLGGDTMYVSMTAAYDGLSDRMRRHIAGLTAHHGFGRFDRLVGNDPAARRRIHDVELKVPHPDHPVVAMHPVTGRRVLYVNRHFTERINELPDDEGRAILEFLLQQTARPEHQLRVSWEPGTVVMWDNRSVQHYAPFDYWPQRRRMERVTVTGAAPFGDGESGAVDTDHVRVAGVDEVRVAAADAPARQFDR